MAIHDVSEYVSWSIPKPIFYIDNLLPQEGSLLLFGDPKVKKSWLVEYMAFCIATGIDWLGFKTAQARVLICQFEVSPYAYHNRLRSMARHFSLQGQALYELTLTYTNLEDNRKYEAFAREIRDSGIAPNVIIIDCLAACFGGDENKSDQMGLFIRKMVELKKEYGASIIIVHHSNKNYLNPSSVGRIRGSTALPGWVDTLVHMVKQPMGIQLQFQARQSVVELYNINVEFKDYLWRVR